MADLYDLVIFRTYILMEALNSQATSSRQNYKIGNSADNLALYAPISNEAAESAVTIVEDGQIKSLPLYQLHFHIGPHPRNLGFLLPNLYAWQKIENLIIITFC